MSANATRHLLGSTGPAWAASTPALLFALSYAQAAGGMNASAATERALCGKFIRGPRSNFMIRQSIRIA
jgi:hypothetical protein